MKSIKRQALEKVGEQIDWDRVRENATKAEVYRAVAAAFDAGLEAAELEVWRTDDREMPRTPEDFRDAACAVIRQLKEG